MIRPENTRYYSTITDFQKRSGQYLLLTEALGMKQRAPPHGHVRLRCLLLLLEHRSHALGTRGFPFFRGEQEYNYCQQRHRHRHAWILRENAIEQSCIR